MIAPTQSLELAVFARDGVKVHRLGDGELVVGRDASASIVLDDESVSRRHAVLRVVGEGVRVTDLGSANGTFLRSGNGGDAGKTHRLRNITQDAEIPIGGVLHFGTVMAVLRAQRDGASPPVVLREPAMRALYDQALRASSALISVLVLGETGVGKEVLARTIHARSTRADGPFLAVSCASLSSTLLESELFGHEKGAFTGATHARPGIIASASGGTLFLDEVGELSPETQVKLLRVLEDRMVMPVGGRAAHRVDVRFVSATNRDLEAACARGAFREDLFFRLNGISLTVPPLRSRPADVGDLAMAFLVAASATVQHATATRIAPQTYEILCRHAWPGNVRELRNVIERAVVLCEGDTLLPEHLPERLLAKPPSPPSDLRADLARVERERVLDALERCGGNQTKAADLLGVSRRTLVARLSEYGLTRPRAQR